MTVYFPQQPYLILQHEITKFAVVNNDMKTVVQLNNPLTADRVNVCVWGGVVGVHTYLLEIQPRCIA